MKPRAILYTVLILLLITSCNKEGTLRIGFKSSFYEDSHGISVFYVNDNANSVYLIGVIFVEQEAVQIELFNSDGLAIYSKQFQSTGISKIDLYFDPSPGCWKLKFVRKQGDGEIDFHASY